MAAPAGPPTIATDPPTTVAELLRRLGGVPAARVRLRPAPGTATEADLLGVLDREGRPCELVEGVLVEKPMGYKESEIAAFVVQLLLNFVRPRRLGIVLTADGMLRLRPGLVRAPDACFIARDRLPGGRRPEEPIPELVPDLAVEVLSPGNTRAEMARKLREYFEAGTRLVWLIDPRARTVRVYTGPTSRPSALLRAADTLDGGDVLPGFAAAVAALFPTEDA